MLYWYASLGVTGSCEAFVNGWYGRSGVDFDVSSARCEASRKPALTWLEAPDGSTSLSTATSVASFALVSSAHTFALIGPVTSVSLASGGVVYVSDVASHVRLSAAHGPTAPEPAVHCAVMREHGLEAGSSGVVSCAGVFALAVSSLPPASR